MQGQVGEQDGNRKGLLLCRSRRRQPSVAPRGAVRADGASVLGAIGVAEQSACVGRRAAWQRAHGAVGGEQHVLRGVA